MHGIAQMLSSKLQTVLVFIRYRNGTSFFAIQIRVVINCIPVISRVFVDTMASDKKRSEEIKRIYTAKKLSECFANVQMTFDNDVQKIRKEM